MGRRGIGGASSRIHLLGVFHEDEFDHFCSWVLLFRFRHFRVKEAMVA